MSRRIFATVKRGMTDNTPVCVFPWELRMLQHIHGGEVEEVTIEQMCDLKDAIKVEKIKHSRSLEAGVKPDQAPDLRQQLLTMAQVDPETDPANDPAAEYNRLADKYGMDKDVPLPVVTRVYGEFSSGAFSAALKEHAAGVVQDKSPDEMSINELRTKLREEGIDFEKTATKEELRDLLATATA